MQVGRMGKGSGRDIWTLTSVSGVIMADWRGLPVRQEGSAILIGAEGKKCK